MIIPRNTIVLDLETAHSADDCLVCGHSESIHSESIHSGDSPPHCQHFQAIGWNNKPALGLSIGCYWDYQDRRIHWFDVHTLETTMRVFVERQPLMVTFNGIGFDFPLMRGLLRRQAEKTPEPLQRARMTLCDTFKVQCAISYDLLAEIWHMDPSSKFQRGNSLDAIAQANGLGAKLSHGAQAPRDWADGRYADVLNYCQDDVYKTKALFEMVMARQPLQRLAQAILLPLPTLQEVSA